MGGGHRVQNTTPMTEYNVWVDPEALEVVLQSGCKVTVVPLDATMECYLTQADADEIRGFGGPGAEAVAFLVDEWLRDYRDDPAMKGYPGVPVHDALAVCAAIDPSILTDLRPVCCHVDIAGGYADGQTCLDLRARLEKEGANCLFAFHADREKFAATLKEILKNG